jgi:hypothetical protein
MQPDSVRLIRPSSAHRRRRCAGSAVMEMLHPETTVNPDAEEGTASHEIAARMVRSLARAGVEFPRVEDVVGASAENGVIWTQESYDGAKMYAETIAETMHANANFAPHIEEPVDISSIHPDLWGTPDCWLFSDSVLFVDDYKFGHLIVEAYENDQLIEYTAGIIDKIAEEQGLAVGILDQQITVVMRITQPRAAHRLGPVRRWTVKASDLRGYINQLKAIEAEATGPDPSTCATPEGCRNCSARHSCDTLQRAGMSSIAYLGKPTPSPLEGHALGLELNILTEAAGIIKARLSGLTAQAEGAIRNGDTTPGWALEPGQSRQTWSSPTADILATGDLLGIDLRKPDEPVTPKQAIAKGIDASVISAYSKQPAGSLRLVPSTKTTAAAVFKRIK